MRIKKLFDHIPKGSRMAVECKNKSYDVPTERIYPQIFFYSDDVPTEHAGKRKCAIGNEAHMNAHLA